MNDLAWLQQHRFQSISRREYDWVFVFDQNVSLVVSCLWRLIECGRIRLTSQDDGQKFGLPAPVDAAAEVNRCLALASVAKVELREGVLDLNLHFSSGHFLQIIPDSAGYESWQLSRGDRQFLAVGGGELAIYGGKEDADDDRDGGV
jgi:hypothetical protein